MEIEKAKLILFTIYPYYYLGVNTPMSLKNMKAGFGLYIGMNEITVVHHQTRRN